MFCASCLPQTFPSSYRSDRSEQLHSKSLYALVDVEVQVAGLSFVIVGVQVRRGSGGLSARLPTHRDVNGA
jgi:hypothetical protein